MRNSSELINYHRKIIFNLEDETKNFVFAKQCLAFLSYIEKNPKVSILSLEQILNIEHIETKKDALNVCEYFSIGIRPIFKKPIFFYIDYSEKEYVLENKREYLSALEDHKIPDSMLNSGYSSFVPLNFGSLSFYFFKNNSIFC